MSSSNDGSAAFEIFDLNVTGASASFVWVTAVSRLGAVHGVPRNDSTLLGSLTKGVQDVRNCIAYGYRDPELANRLGNELKDLVFDVPEVRTLFERTRGAAADRGRQLLIRLMAAPHTVAAFPWELMGDPDGGTHSFLSRSPDVHIVRLARVRTYPVHQVPVKPPLRMLLVLSSPLGSLDGEHSNGLTFDLYEEKRALLNELAPLLSRGLLEVDVEDRPSIENLRRCIARKERGYNVLHYIGHGLPGRLLLEDPSGRALETYAAQFNSVLQSCPDLRLIFFAGCETAQTPDESSTPWPAAMSLADMCVRDVCQVVVGMQAVLPFRTERLFCRFFYQAVASGRTIGDAMTVARAAVADDVQSGTGLLDWAVPCVFVGGDSPGYLVDPEAPARPVAPTRRAELKLDLREGDREFFARHIALRETIDYLAGRRPYRVLWVTGEAGVGKTRLVGRALEDVGEQDIELVLYVPLDRLLQEADPVRSMCELVAELLTRRDAKPRAQSRSVRGAAWWERLIEEVVHRPIAIVIDDFDVLDEKASSARDRTRRPRARTSGVRDLRTAIVRLIERRTQARLVLIARQSRADLVPDTEGRAGQVRLEPLGWEDVYRWIRRNRPALAHRFDQPVLLKFFSEVGSRLESWNALADAADQMPDAKASDLFARARTQVLSVSESAAEPVVEVRAKSHRTTRQTPSIPSLKERPTGLRVAVAGPFVDCRQAEFAASLTTAAASYRVRGRAVTETPGDPSTPLATLLPIPTPFKKDGSAPSSQVLTWLQKARAAGANIVLADYGATVPMKAQDIVLESLTRAGILVLAASTNDRKPIYPAWNPDVLAIGSLGETGNEIAENTYFDAEAGKPELFAPARANTGPLAALLINPETKGSSVSALWGVLASVLVWATAPNLTADQVRDILLRSSRPLEPTGGNRRSTRGTVTGPRALDIDAALNEVRRVLVRQAVGDGRAFLAQEIVASTGLPASITLEHIGAMVTQGELTEIKSGNEESYRLQPKGREAGVAAGSVAPAAQIEGSKT
jgi:hypothetical protein